MIGVIKSEKHSPSDPTLKQNAMNELTGKFLNGYINTMKSKYLGYTNDLVGILSQFVISSP